MQGDGASASVPGDRGRTDPGDRPLPPGPDGLPLVGNTLGFMRDPWSFYDTLAEHGDVVSYEIARMDFTAVLHPEYVEQVLVHDVDAFRKWFGEEFADVNFAPEGLVFAEGEQWRRQRTAIQDAFTLDRIRGYVEPMRRFAVEMVEGWNDGEEIALNRAFSDLTLRVLAHTLFDLDVRAADGEFVRECLTAINARADGRNVSNLLPKWVPTPTRRRYQRAVADLRAYVDDLIDERRGHEAEYDDLLSLFLTAEDGSGRGLSGTEVRDGTITFLGAGTETTALALTYAFLELARHDDVRRSLAAEHAEVLGGDPPTLADLDRLAYTDRVIDETLRLYPPAYAMFREAAEDVAVGGYRVPAGTKVVVPQFYLQADERWYDDPGAFRPDRWTDEFEWTLPDYAYFPFGGGPRHCIGMRFAMMELKHVVPTVAQNVEFELLSDPDPDFTLGVTLQPADDVRVRVHKRDVA